MDKLNTHFNFNFANALEFTSTALSAIPGHAAHSFAMHYCTCFPHFCLGAIFT